jgi:ankyrin repeat protein
MTFIEIGKPTRPVHLMPENKDHIDLDGWDLHRAARENSVDRARAFIARGDDVNARDKVGDTPLHDAAWYNSRHVARMILELGAEVNTRDEDGESPPT